MLDVPVFHVNGDDPEACVHVARLATEFRQTFKSDVVIDLICYRRYGHNEGDDPSFTQPHMYELIRKQPTVRDAVRQGAGRARAASPPRSPRPSSRRCLKEFDDALTRIKQARQFKEPSALEGLWKPYKGGSQKNAPEVPTAVDKAQAARRAEEAVRRRPRASTCTRWWSARCSRSACPCWRARSCSGPRARRWPTPRCSPRATRCACPARTASAAPSATATRCCTT